jgi:hypothetical protein
MEVEGEEMDEPRQLGRVAEGRMMPKRAPAILKLRPELLSEEKIAFKHRIKLFAWISESMASLYSSREMVATAFHLFDLTVQNSTGIRLRDIQGLGIACIRLSLKQHETFYQPPAIGKHFKVEDIVRDEFKIAILLNYKLYYKTFPIFIEELVHLWDQFVEDKEDMQALRIVKEGQEKQSTTYMVNIFNKLECINNFVSSHRFTQEELCLNLFYLDRHLKHQEVDMDQDWLMSLPDRLADLY